MAQLGNLLVTGSSRFLQKVYFADDISTDGKVDSNGLTVGDKIQLLPNQASFNVPVTVSSNFTVSGGTVTTDRINSKSVYVADVLNATRYEISTIQSLGGIVDVCPSFKTSSSATVTITSVSSSINVGYNFDGATSVSLTGYYRVVIKDTKQITSSTICGSTWTRYSKVKITGTLAGNSCNSINAYLLYDLNSNTAGAITLIIPKTSFSVSGTVSNMSCPDVDIILVDIYKSINGGTSKRRPVGMYLSSYNGSVGTGISIYSGDADSPSLLLGDLSNSTLPTINNLTPQGWGLYATNAYLQGIIVSESGKIGGFSIDSNSLTNGSIGTSGSVLMSTGTTTLADIGGSGSKSGWAFTAGNSYGVTNNGELYASSGKIGGWNITGSGIMYKTDAYEVYMLPMDNNNKDFLVVHDLTEDTYPFYVRGDGLHVTRGEIGGWTISDNALYSGIDNINPMIGIETGNYIGTDGICNSGTYGILVISDGHIESNNGSEGRLFFGFSETIALRGYKGNPNSINSFTIYNDGLAMFSNLSVTNNITMSGEFYADKHIHLANAMSLRSYDTNGNDRQVIGINNSNNVMIGWGTYSNKDTSTTAICGGNKIQFQLGKQNAIWRPYYTAGDTITFNSIKTTGFITNNKTDVHFNLSLDRPIIGATKATVVAADSNGLIIRQAGKYLYSSDGSSNPAIWAYPKSTSVGIMNGCFNILARFSSDSNVINNDVCGLLAHLIIKLE